MRTKSCNYSVDYEVQQRNEGLRGVSLAACGSALAAIGSVRLSVRLSVCCPHVRCPSACPSHACLFVTPIMSFCRFVLERLVGRELPSSRDFVTATFRETEHIHQSSGFNILHTGLHRNEILGYFQTVI